jgi:hypothetical protein
VLRGERKVRKDPFKRHVLGVSKDFASTCPNDPQCEHSNLVHEHRPVLRCTVKECPCTEEESNA